MSAILTTAAVTRYARTHKTPLCVAATVDTPSPAMGGLVWTTMSVLLEQTTVSKSV